MVLSALFILDLKGKIVITRAYRGDVQPSVVETFAKHLAEDEENDLTPIIHDGEVHFVYVKHNNLYFMAVTKHNSNCVEILEFLFKVIEVFKKYFTTIEEESIRDNFVIIYELLDEMMDFGYPQHTDATILQQYICVQESHKLEATPLPPAAITNAVSWRNPGIVHKSNEIFIDVTEKLNLLVGTSGKILHSEIVGNVKVRSFLSGMPELKLGLNEKVIFKNVGVGREENYNYVTAHHRRMIEMEDVRFHQCVRLSRFETDHAITFIPPDGEFELMNYRLPASNIKPLIWIDAKVDVHSHSRVEYTIKCKSNCKRRCVASKVVVYIPVPGDADTPKTKPTMGTAAYVPEKDAIVWTIQYLQGDKECSLSAQMGLPSVTSPEDIGALTTRPITVEFDIPYFTISGINVRYLKITEKSGYHGLPWVRYLTQNGDFQVRISPGDENAKRKIAEPSSPFTPPFVPRSDPFPEKL